MEMVGFATTRWSLIQQACGDGAGGRAALEELCRSYRDPVAAYIRRHGAHAGEVEDLVQSFFLRFVERALHVRADPLRGGFRPFLLASLRNFLHNEADAAATLKRGGNAARNPEWLDSIASEDAEPERAFDRAWALSVVGRALAALREQA